MVLHHVRNLLGECLLWRSILSLTQRSLLPRGRLPLILQDFCAFILMIRYCSGTICGKNTVNLSLSVENYTSQSNLCSLRERDEFKTKHAPAPPIVSLGFKVWEPGDFLVPGFPGCSSTNLGLEDNTVVPCCCLWRHHVMLFSIAFEIQIGTSQTFQM